jgi:protein SCO1
MKKNWLKAFSTIISLTIGICILFIGTDGFQAFTAESARTYKLMLEKPHFPDVILEDSTERVYTFSEFEGKYVLLTFIYTACTDVCPKLEMNLNEVYQQIPDKYIGEDIIFLSISFDPDRDDPKTLNKYAKYFSSDEETWRMARIPNKEELQNLLDEFGVIVLPDGNGGFAHNSAFYFVDREGFLIEVMDYEQTDKAAEKVLEKLQSDEAEGKK